jgi:hypothetical protein
MNIQAFGLVWYPDDSEGSWYSTITDGYFETISGTWSPNSVASIASVPAQASVSDDDLAKARGGDI